MWWQNESWWIKKKDRREKDWRRGQSVDIHILASRRNVAFWEKANNTSLFSLNALLFNNVDLPVSPLPILIAHFIPPLINFISPHRLANAAVLVRLPGQPQLLGNTQLSIIHSRSLTDEERECQGNSEKKKRGGGGGGALGENKEETAKAWNQGRSCDAERWRWCSGFNNLVNDLFSFGFLLWLKPSINPHFPVSRRVSSFINRCWVSLGHFLSLVFST